MGVGGGVWGYRLALFLYEMNTGSVNSNGIPWEYSSLASSHFFLIKIVHICNTGLVTNTKVMI